MEMKVQLIGVEKALASMDYKKVVTAGKRAITRAANSGKTIISSQIRDKFRIAKADIDRKINVSLKNINNLEGDIEVKGEPLSLMYFKPESITGSGIRTHVTKGVVAKTWTKKKATGGVKVKILKKGRFAILPKSFIARGSGGTQLVFRRMRGVISSRTGREKLAARKLVTYPSIVKEPMNLSAIRAKINTVLVDRFKHELDREWGK
jgi:hypothetical protein